MTGNFNRPAYFSGGQARLLIVCGAAVAFLLASPSVDVRASDAPPSRALSSEDALPSEATSPVVVDQKSPGPTDKSKAADRPGKRNDDLDRQLLRDLLPDLPLDLKPSTEKPSDKDSKTGEPRSRIPLADELDETVEAMREVSRRLDKRSLSDETEQLQAGIVTNIDALIEKLKNLPPPSSSSSSDQSDQNPSDQDSPQQDPQTEQKQRPQPNPPDASQNQHGTDSTTGSAPQPQTDKAAESSEQNLREARERAVAMARRRALVDEVWGHLPPAMRERLLNVGSEKLLPKYEDLIRRYYESLAEPDKSTQRR
jgi:hypothetical protein